jgi:hypothetical protein
MRVLGCAAMVAVVGCDRTTNTEKQTKEDAMTNDTNETNETALSQHCARLFYAAKEADVPTVIEEGTFMPTLYVATEKGGYDSQSGWTGINRSTARHGGADDT